MPEKILFASNQIYSSASELTFFDSELKPKVRLRGCRRYIGRAWDVLQGDHVGNLHQNIVSHRSLAWKRLQSDFQRSTRSLGLIASLYPPTAFTSTNRSSGSGSGQPQELIFNTGPCADIGELGFLLRCKGMVRVSRTQIIPHATRPKLLFHFPRSQLLPYNRSSGCVPLQKSTSRCKGALRSSVKIFGPSRLYCTCRTKISENSFIFIFFGIYVTQFGWKKVHLDLVQRKRRGWAVGA